MIRLLPERTPGTPFRILCLGAHSDDIEIGCGGTVLTLAERYGNDLDLRWVVMSGGDARKKEAEESAKRFLANVRRTEVRVFGYRDGFFPQSWGEIKEVFETLKKGSSPDIVFTHYREDRHQDHRIISDLTWNTFRNHCILEYEIPKFDGDLGSPNAFVPLSDEVASAKVRHLLEAFPSQLDKHWFTGDTFTAILRLRGLESGGTAKHAEAFYARKVQLL